MTKAEQKYIEVMRRKTGEERLKIALELRKLVLKLAEADIKSRYPKISLKELKKKLQERIYGSTLPSKISSK